MKKIFSLAIIIVSQTALAEADYSGIEWLPLYVLAVVAGFFSLVGIFLSASSKVKFARTKISIFFIIVLLAASFIFFGPI